MFVKTDSGMLNLDHVILVQINNKFHIPRDNEYQLEAITTNIYESSRERTRYTREHHTLAHKPATISPYSVNITQGILKDCQNRFDKISEQDTFIKFTKNRSPKLLNVKHIIDVVLKQSPSDQSDYLNITLNTFNSESTKIGAEYGSCYFPSLSPYELYLSDDDGNNCKEIMESIEKFGIL